MNRRTFLTFVGLGATLTATGTVTGCAQGSETSGGAKDMLTLNGDRADFVPGYEAAGAELKKVTGFGLAPRNVPTTENYEQVVRSSLQSTTATDIVKWWSGYRLQDLARSGGLVNLDGEWKKAVAKGWVNPDTEASFSYDGHVYAMPMYKSLWVIYYNKDVYSKLGLAVPTTWDEFVGNAVKIKRSGVTPFFATQEAGWTSFIWFGEILSKLDPDFYVDLLNGEAKYTDAPAKEAMEIWADLYAQDLFTSPDVPWDDEPAMFKKGEVAMVPMGTWRNAAFQDSGMTPDDYGAFIMPTVKPDVRPSVIMESGIFSVPANAPHKDDAVKGLGEWLNPKVQKVWIEQIKDVSANPQVPVGNPVLTSVTDQVKSTEPVELERYWEGSPPALIEGNVQDLATFMVEPATGKIPALLSRMQERAEKEWAEWEAK